MFTAVVGCSSAPKGTTADPNVLGWLDSIDDAGNASGWSLIPSFTTHPMETAVFCDGDRDTGTLIYTVRANKPREDVAMATGVAGSHGFEFAIPDALKDGKSHVIHDYGMGPSGLVELDGSPRTIEIAGTGSGCGPRADGSNDVMGNFDTIDQNGVVNGWALVPSFTSHPIEVAVFADTMLLTSRANTERDDLGAQFGTTHHGFVFDLPEEVLNDQPHTLTVYGVGPNGFAELVGSPRDFKLANPEPRGVIDTVDADGNVSGWALVPSLVPASIDVDLYIDDPSGTGTKIATVHADQPRDDVNQATGYAGDHGFVFAIPDAFRDETDHQIYGFAVGPRSTKPVGASAFNLARRYHARKGVVTANGRNFVDGDGAFYPLGGTVMWALWGWQNDRARLEDNLEFLAKHHYDYIRILAEVDWPDEAISPSWPDYAQQLGDLIDRAYDRYGLRTEITMIGGGAGVDVPGLAQTVAAVVNAGRQHKILDIEIANESYQRPISLATMRSAGSYLIQNLPGQLIALSSAEGLGTYVPGSTNFLADTISTYLQPGTANLLTIHMDRTYGDDGWRATRQPWDWKDQGFPISHNEPIGPRSSVAEEVDPIRLAMLRAVGIINGVDGFVLHNGAGVTGRVDPAHNRPANLWEVPNIDAIMDAVRGVDAILPPHAGDGQHWNNGWAGSPWNADAFWASGADHGVNRNYTVSTADGWISTEAGIKGYVVMTPRQHCRVEVFDILEGKVMDVELQGGQTLTLTPFSRDSNNDGALIVIGHYL